MPRLNADTRAEIRGAALQLFATNGFDQTSLREIAERIGITKAALYYHFASKAELLAELVAPLLDDLRDFPLDASRPRAVLEDYFDLCHRHRLVFQGLVHDTGAMSRLGLLDNLIQWRGAIEELLVPDDAPAERVRAVIALGGLQDCVVIYPDAPVESIKTAAVGAAARALKVDA